MRSAAEGQEALQMIQAQRPDLVVLDLGLPFNDSNSSSLSLFFERGERESGKVRKVGCQGASSLSRSPTFIRPEASSRFAG